MAYRLLSAEEAYSRASNQMGVLTPISANSWSRGRLGCGSGGWRQVKHRPGIVTGRPCCLGAAGGFASTELTLSPLRIAFR